MNRRQRRAAGLHKPTAARQSRPWDPLKPILPAEVDPNRRYLRMSMRHMKVADFVPGYDYAPSAMMFEIELPTVPGQPGMLWQMPLDVPPHLREPTPENTQTLYAFLYLNDPEARRIIDHMRSLARPWHEVAAAADLPKEYVGRVVLPPGAQDRGLH